VRDAVIVEDGAGIPIGYAHFRSSDVVAAVDPRREGEGAGTKLLQWAEKRGRERGASKLRQAIGDRGAAGRALLTANGWAPARSFWRMEREVRPGETADESDLRELRDTDAPALHAIAEAAFAGDGAYQSQSLETWAQREFSAHGLDHELSRVAERNGEPIGFALARRWEEETIYVPLLAVHPDAAGKGLGGRLLTAVFAAAGAAGQRSVRLNVASDNPNAVRLYERVGMSQRWRVDDYQKSLPD
jgi:ribosomal protein S18 acetylase RimI-like enzyme